MVNISIFRRTTVWKLWQDEWKKPGGSKNTVRRICRALQEVLTVHNSLSVSRSQEKRDPPECWNKKKSFTPNHIFYCSHRTPVRDMFPLPTQYSFHSFPSMWKVIISSEECRQTLYINLLDLLHHTNREDHADNQATNKAIIEVYFFYCMMNNRGYLSLFKEVPRECAIKSKILSVHYSQNV